MRGSLRKRGVSWQIRVFVGVDPTTGKKPYRSKSVRGTRREAESELTKMVRDMETIGFVVTERITLGEYLRRWLDDALPASSRSERTRRTYASIVNRHLILSLSHVPLPRLTPAMLEHCYATKSLSDGSDGLNPEPRQPRSATTVAHHHAVLHGALDHAMRYGSVGRNVADVAEHPGIKRKATPVWTAEEVRKFLAVAQEDRYYVLFLAAITTGMRQGKLLGLRWRAVDLDAGTAHVQQTLLKAGAKPLFGAPKTERSRRRVLLLPELTSALRQHQIAQSAERVDTTDTHVDYGLVFTTPGGAPIHASNLQRRHFFPLITEAGVPRIRFHDLRHRHATLLLPNGVHPKIVSERLGHATVAITLDISSHVLPEMQQDAVDGLQRRVFATA